MNTATSSLLSSPIFRSSFNWTMTYRQDSDIFHPYGKIIFDPRNSPFSSPSLTKIVNKSSLAIWPVSHCSTNGKREVLVKDLARYIQIDIVGACGNKKKEIIYPAVEKGLVMINVFKHCLNHNINFISHLKIPSVLNTLLRNYLILGNTILFPWFMVDLIEMI